MVHLIVISLAIIAGSCFATPNRIVGGEPTTIDKYPSTVQVDELDIFGGGWYQVCAANILTSRYVLSAAHCFKGFLYFPEWRRIRAGATARNFGGVVISVEREFNHPSYGDWGRDGDISVVRLTHALTYSPVIQQGTIISHGSVIPDNMPVVYAGWGSIAANGPSSSVLRDVTVYTINNNLCRERYSQLGEIVTENMICTGILDVGGRDACSGDSGGPLFYGDIIVGLVSWGLGCANGTFPGVATRISSYTDWIVSVAV